MVKVLNRSQVIKPIKKIKEKIFNALPFSELTDLPSAFDGPVNVLLNTVFSSLHLVS